MLRIFCLKAAIVGAMGLGCLFVPLVLAQNTAPVPTLQTRPQPQAKNNELTEAVSSISPKALQSYRQAIRELHHGQAAAAEKDARRALHLKPNFADADALAATAALAQKQFVRARDEASRAVQGNAADEKAWVILATVDNYLGSYAEAVEALGHVRQQDQATWQVAYQWARAEAGQEHAQAALDWSNRAALSAPPEFAPLHLLLASALLAAGQYARAADELGTYLQLLGANAPERAELTQELARLRKLSRAPAEYNALAN